MELCGAMTTSGHHFASTVGDGFCVAGRGSGVAQCWASRRRRAQGAGRGAGRGTGARAPTPLHHASLSPRGCGAQRRSAPLSGAPGRARQVTQRKRARRPRSTETLAREPGCTRKLLLTGDNSPRGEGVHAGHTRTSAPLRTMHGAHASPGESDTADSEPRTNYPESTISLAEVLQRPRHRPAPASQCSLRRPEPAPRAAFARSDLEEPGQQ